MTTPRTKPSVFFADDAQADDLFITQQRKAKLEGYVKTLAAIDRLMDFSAMAVEVDAVCPRPDRSKGGRPPYATAVMLRMVFLQGLYNLSDEQCEHQLLDRMSFQRFCRVEGSLNVPDARTLWNFRQRLAAGGLGGQTVFDAVSRTLQRLGYIPRRLQRSLACQRLYGHGGKPSDVPLQLGRQLEAKHFRIRPSVRSKCAYWPGDLLLQGQAIVATRLARPRATHGGAQGPQLWGLRIVLGLAPRRVAISTTDQAQAR
ncbi:transposase [Ideonella livida]|uniref:transposase n=1 Tax=Ideonella livida TaxID=2707176 RepID=UPI001EF28C98|nr:transposase [Ideonella livida]